MAHVLQKYQGYMKVTGRLSNGSKMEGDGRDNKTKCNVGLWTGSFCRTDITGTTGNNLNGVWGLDDGYTNVHFLSISAFDGYIEVLSLFVGMTHCSIWGWWIAHQERTLKWFREKKTFLLCFHFSISLRWSQKEIISLSPTINSFY